MQRLAQYTVILKIFQTSVIHISRKYNDKIANLSLIQVPQLSQIYRAIILQVVSATTNQNAYLNYHKFH